ncbi:MAG: hypothetical protein HQL66_01085 [Magnetococcales bacterium]|nr:hypothetical protein [Magnetococcales bacterium]
MVRWDFKRIRSRSLGGIAKLLNVILVLAISYTCSEVVIDWMSGSGGRENKPQSPNAGDKSGGKGIDAARSGRRETLAGLTLFGGKAGVVIGENGADLPGETGSQGLPETKLEIQLIGVVFSGDPGSGGRALIKTGPEEEKSYRVGDRIAGGPKIKEILFDHVILERDGHREILRLPRSLLTVEQLSPRKKSQSPTAQVAARQGATSSGPKDALRRLRDLLRLSPDSVLEMVRIDPYFNGGTFEGFKLFPGKDPEYLKQFGLENGDIIIEVNDVRMTDPLKGMEAMAQLAAADTIHLRVKRGADIIPYEFSLDR